jgi:hypothetical protein
MLVGMSAVSSIVGEHDVPESVRTLITLDGPDYVDLFTAEAPTATTEGASAEEWARAILERAPVSRRNARRFWRLMGLRLGPPGSPEHVQGWKIAARGGNWVRLETGSWYLTAQAVCLVESGRVSLSLSVRRDRQVAALVWAFVEGPHRRAVPVMLHQAVKLMTADVEDRSAGHEQG